MFDVFNTTYTTLFPDMNFYYPFLFIGGFVVVFISVILLVGITIKFGEFLGDLLL